LQRFDYLLLIQLVRYFSFFPAPLPPRNTARSLPSRVLFSPSDYTGNNLLAVVRAIRPPSFSSWATEWLELFFFVIEARFFIRRFYGALFPSKLFIVFPVNPPAF